MDARLLSKCVVAQIETAAIESRPWNAGTSKPCLEAIELEGPTLEDAIVGVDPRDQFILDCCPIPPQSIEHHHVDGDAIVLHPGGGGHISTA